MKEEMYNTEQGKEIVDIKKIAEKNSYIDST